MILRVTSATWEMRLSRNIPVCVFVNLNIAFVHWMTNIIGSRRELALIIISAAFSLCNSWFCFHSCIFNVYLLSQLLPSTPTSSCFHSRCDKLSITSAFNTPPKGLWVALLLTCISKSLKVAMVNSYQVNFLSSWPTCSRANAPAGMRLVHGCLVHGRSK